MTNTWKDEEKYLTVEFTQIFKLENTADHQCDQYDQCSQLARLDHRVIHIQVLCKSTSLL